jgi:hypothetical protein
MYSTCISCNADLGRNESIEAFPVGRRVAFDSSTGRLWVLCRRCRRWNLAPIEERWEAVEAGERLFKTASVGASTENIALGRTREGMDLIRIGRADRREFAGWRYGRELLSRRRRMHAELFGAGTQSFAMSGVYFGLLAGGFVVSPWLLPAGILGISAVEGSLAFRKFKRPAVAVEGGRDITRFQASRARLVESPEHGGWSLIVPSANREELRFEGVDAFRILRRAFPDLNPWGGGRDEVVDAVSSVERFGSAGETMREAARALRGVEHWWTGRGKPGSISAAPRAVQLALEIAVNEETERCALAGELQSLEREWREAEALAAVADRLLLPAHLEARIRRWKVSGSGTN